MLEISEEEVQHVWQECNSEFQELLQMHKLPNTFLNILRDFYIPTALWVQQHKKKHCPVIGVNGAQGTGKSTMVMFLKKILQKTLDWNVVTISIDDLYYSKEKRQQLAKKVHPLLQTRGVPGTHDIQLGIQVIQQLKQLNEQTSCRIPRFNKAVDNPYPQEQWSTVSGVVDCIFLEGWCVSTIAQSEEELATPMNQLEAQEDSDQIWRRYVNEQLRDHYPKLFDLLEGLILLKAPRFEKVYQWRWEQEQKLKQSLVGSSQPDQTMNDEELVRFIHHYERLTRFNLAVLPAKSDIVLFLDETHQINDFQVK